MWSSNVRAISRQELYELVWQRPIVEFAREFGVSDVGLAKACRRANIPLPPRGYWAKLGHGKRVGKRPKLPSIPAGQSETVRIRATPERAAPEPIPDDIAKLIAIESSRVEPIKIPKDPTTWHAILKKWRAPSTSLHGYIQRRKLTPTENRLHRVLNALLRELEKRGASTREEKNHLITHLAGEDVEFSFTERLRQVQVPLSESERRSIFYNGQDHKKVNEPSGELKFRLLDYFDVNIRREWHDRNEQPIETQLRAIVIGMCNAAAQNRKRRLEREEYQRQALIAEQKRWRLQELRSKVKSRVDELRREAASWVEARELREFAEVKLEAMRAQGTHEPAMINELALWMKTVADVVDPLVDVNEEALFQFANGGEDI